jgi:hypothetical protein
MKTSKKGFAITIIIAIVALLIVGGVGYNIINTKPGPNKNLIVIPTNTSTINTVSKNQNNNTLTEQDILSATYTLSANFNGKKTTPQKVKLPYIPNEEAAQKNKERLYITKDGSVVTDNKSGGEMFYISSYKFIDSSNQGAIVYVTGSFGASGYDNRTFIVTKVNGQVVTQEK